MDHHNLAELIHACERLLIVGFAGLSMWLGWLLICPLRNTNGFSSAGSNWQRLLRGITPGLFAIYFVAFGSFLLVAAFFPHQVNQLTVGFAAISVEKPK
ncbi:hypothetical protein AB9E09_09695 [Rhizobium leguminosarum]|uniref:hypothetical protein n=1 Tax=Rhizobium leguminosarum TaxID=384 RepID=UPI003F977A45